MQAIYINGTQIHSNTTDLGFVINEPIVGLDFPDIRFSKYDKAGEHGSIVTSQFYSGRQITFSGRVSGSTISQYLANRRKLQSLLSIVMDSVNNATPLLLTFTTLDGLNLQCYCYANKKPNFTERSLNHAFFILELYAPDHNLYDQSQQVQQIFMPSGGGATYPIVYPIIYSAVTGGSAVITNAGDSDTFPVVTFQGPLTANPFIENVTTGQSFQVNLTLHSTDTLVVDMANKTMVLNNSQNALSYFDIANQWISLTEGNNTIRVGSGLSSDTGYVQVAFRNAYLGV